MISGETLDAIRHLAPEGRSRLSPENSNQALPARVENECAGNGSLFQQAMCFRGLAEG